MILIWSSYSAFIIMTELEEKTPEQAYIYHVHKEGTSAGSKMCMDTDAK